MYFERRFQPLWLLALGTVMTVSLGIAYGSVLAPSLGWALGAFTTIAVVWWWFSSASIIRVSPAGLTVGKFHIEPEFIGAHRCFDADEFADRIRAGAKTTDLLSILHHESGGVEISIRDQRDPYRHWVVGTRNPDQLGSALALFTSSQR